MNYYIHIDGLSFFVFMVLLIIGIFLTIFLGVSLLSTNRENRDLKKENRQLKIDLDNVSEKLYKATFRVPEID